MTIIEAEPPAAPAKRVFFTRRRRALLAILLVLLPSDGKAREATENAFKYAQPKTGYLMLSPADFVPMASNATTFIGESGILTSSNAQDCFLAPVHLPHGTTIKQLRPFYQRPSSDDTVFVYLRRINAAGTIAEPVANDPIQVAPVKQSGVVSYTAHPARNVVNNAQFSYLVGLCIANQGRLISARIEYTYTTAGD